MLSAFAAAIPFNTHLGLAPVEAQAGRATVRLPEHPHLLNHLGTQHASGLFAAAEAASGLATVTLVADIIDEVLPLATGASIAFTRLARGVIDASAEVMDVATVSRSIREQSMTAFVVDVVCRDARGRTVATARVDWQVRRRA